MNGTLMTSWRSLVMGFVALLCAGCGSGEAAKTTGQVEGTVTLNGQLLPDGGVSFYDEATGNSAGGMIENGKFIITESVETGDYKVAVHPPAPPQPEDEASGEQARSDAALIPEGYQDESSSGLTATVVEGPNSFQFALVPEGPPRQSAAQNAP